MPDQDDDSDINHDEVGQKDEKDDTKAFTKKSFREPMSRLSDELELYYKYLCNEGYGYRLKGIPKEYNVIQKMIGHGTCFKLEQEDEGESSQNDLNENGSEDDTNSYHSSDEIEGRNDDDLKNNTNQGNDD